jgi:hypothetical protein
MGTFMIDEVYPYYLYLLHQEVTKWKQEVNLKGFFETFGRDCGLWETGPMKNESKSFEALFKFCCKSVKANSSRFSECENLKMAHLEPVCSLQTTNQRHLKFIKLWKSSMLLKCN